MKTIAYLAPFGKDGSLTRKRTDCVYKIFETLAADKQYELCRADKEPDSSIIASIERIIRESDIVIADISEYNANVFYECGLRNAIKGRIIYICCGKCEKVPFDITQDRVNSYEYDEDKNIVTNELSFYRDLSRKIESTAREPKRIFFDLKPEEISSCFDVSILTQYNIGKKDHYFLADKIARKPCKNIFLMQRSSSIILGAERGWAEEDRFLNNVLKAAENCENFCHVITLEGIVDHLKRKDSFFPDFSKYSQRLRKGKRGCAELALDDPSRHFAVKKLPQERNEGYFKLDRQARVFMAEFYDGMISTVIVQNLGENQLSFWAEGTAQLEKYLHDCIDFYRGLEDVKLSEIEELYNAYGKPIDEEND